MLTLRKLLLGRLQFHFLCNKHKQHDRGTYKLRPGLHGAIHEASFLTPFPIASDGHATYLGILPPQSSAISRIYLHVLLPSDPFLRNSILYFSLAPCVIPNPNRIAIYYSAEEIELQTLAPIPTPYHIDKLDLLETQHIKLDSRSHHG